MSFISCRRYYLDQELNKIKNCFKGKVLDIGGQKNNKRGEFTPPYENVEEWLYLNNNTNTNPDILLDLSLNVPLKDNSIDIIICTEVMEYIYDYQHLLKEIKRILKDGGLLILSIPFIHNFHADYESDYFRFTESLIKKEMANLDFNINYFSRMGGIFSVVFDLFRGYMSFQTKRTILIKLLYKSLLLVNKLFILLDKVLINNNFYINTGYFIVGEKNEYL